MLEFLINLSSKVRKRHLTPLSIDAFQCNKTDTGRQSEGTKQLSRLIWLMGRPQYAEASDHRVRTAAVNIERQRAFQALAREFGGH